MKITTPAEARQVLGIEEKEQLLYGDVLVGIAQTFVNLEERVKKLEEKVDYLDRLNKMSLI